MPRVSSALANQAQIAQAVKHAQSLLGPEIIRIRHELGQNWIGEDATLGPRLREVARRATDTIRNEVAPEK